MEEEYAKAKADFGARYTLTRTFLQTSTGFRICGQVIHSVGVTLRSRPGGGLNVIGTQGDDYVQIGQHNTC